MVNMWGTILNHYANQGPKSVLSGARRYFFMRASAKKASCFSEGSIINHHFITFLLQKENMELL